MRYDHGGRASTRKTGAQAVPQAATNVTSGFGGHAARQLAKQGVPIALTLVVLGLFADQFATLDRAAIWAAILNVSLLQWTLASLATICSFWALGRYDAVLHRHLETGVDRVSALRSGITAIAVSQTLGFGLVTGALARWRMVPSLSIWQATRVSAVVAGSFLGGWAVVVAVCVLMFGLPTRDLSMGMVALCLVPLALAAVAVVASLLRSNITLGRITLRLPSIPTILTIIGLAAADTICAALALYVLLPTDITLTFGALYVAFLLSFGCAMISATPGGVGSFEISMIALLPVIPVDTLVGAIVAYRIIYYAVPAVLGTVALAIGPRGHHKRGMDIAFEAVAPALMMPRAIETLIKDAPRSEAHFLRQGGKGILSRSDGTPDWVTAKTGQALVAMGDPLTKGSHRSAIDMLVAGAAAHNRLACIYKCGARMAVAARRAGHIVAPIAQEAWIAPATFTFETSKRRQLRRKLRKAQNVVITANPKTMPWAEMAKINSAWKTRHGGERGFSMGQYTETYVRRQQVFCAYQNDVLVAFVTFNATDAEWGLDLMRSSDDMPDGTMHALVAKAIECAAIAQIPRLSLAAVPSAIPEVSCKKSRVIAKVRTLFDAATGASGLAQFKRSFAPNWETLYVAAPSWFSLISGCFDIGRAINAPDITSEKPDNDIELNQKNEGRPVVQ